MFHRSGFLRNLAIGDLDVVRPALAISLPQHCLELFYNVAGCG